MTDGTLKSIDADDLDRKLTVEDRLIMAETILAWADLDTGISRLILLAFGLEDDLGSILIGNMDLKTKVEKIKMLYDHCGDSASASHLAKLSTAIQKFSECRNTVAHRKVIGRLISQPTRLVFLSAKHVKRQRGVFEMLNVDHAELIMSAKFAREASVRIHSIVINFEDSRDNRRNGKA